MVGKKLGAGVSVAALAALLASSGASAGTGYVFRSRPVVMAAPAAAPSLALDAATLPKAETGKDWSYDFTALAKPGKASAGSAVTWSASGLPGWLTLSASGIASGKPAAPARSRST